MVEADDEPEYTPIFSLFRWELWPWTDSFRWMVTHDRLIICEWRRRGGLRIYTKNLLARVKRLGREVAALLNSPL